MPGLARGSKFKGYYRLTLPAIMNIEGMYSVYHKKTERSDSILRNSAVWYSIFCGSLFNRSN